MSDRSTYYCRERCDERFDNAYDRMRHEEAEAERATFERRERARMEQAEEEAYFEAQAADQARQAEEYAAYCREMEERRYCDDMALASERKC